MRRYAETTAVPISRSRGEIDKLLRDWGARAIQWGDDFEADTATLRFVWVTADASYQARLVIRLQPASELVELAKDNRTGRLAEGKYSKLLDARGKREHRVLLLWLKAALNAVDMGLVSAEALFLPFLEGKDGRTVAEVALPRLEKLLTASASKLLPAGGES